MSKTNNDDENTKHASLALKTETMPSEDGEPKNADVPVESTSKEDVADDSKSTEQIEKEEKIDPYAYLQRDEFTTEIYKIEIKNLPRYTGHTQLLKRLTTSLGLNPKKLKIVENGQIAFCNFTSAEERLAALGKISGHTFKGHTLEAKFSLPRQDPRLKRMRELQDDKELAAKKRKEGEIEEALPEDVRVNNVVAAYWKDPYEVQLQKKTEELQTFLNKLAPIFCRQNKDLKTFINKQRALHGGMICQVDKIIPSPVLTNYRNKCEFTINVGLNGKDKTCGFRLGSYSSGQLAVGGISGCILVKDGMKIANKYIEEYLQSHSELPSYDTPSKTGHWRVALMRCTSRGDVLVSLICVRNQLTEEEVNKEFDQLKAFFTADILGKSGIVSLFFTLQDVQDEANLDMRHVAGEQHIVEDLLGLKFRISPKSFFQVNTAAAELLYAEVGRWCSASKDAVVLDICCGTGTIGLSIAKDVKSVIGIEMCDSAVKDAKHNADLNDIKNAKFYCGRAETTLPVLIHSLCTKDVVAIVDPPRPGLHKDVVKSIRNTHYIKKVVYVSCNQKGAIENLTMFTSSKSRRLSGEPFKLVRAMPVDLFPQTPMYELIMLLER